MDEIDTCITSGTINILPKCAVEFSQLLQPKRPDDVRYMHAPMVAHVNLQKTSSKDKRF